MNAQEKGGGGKNEKKDGVSRDCNNLAEATSSVVYRIYLYLEERFGGSTFLP